MMKTSPFDWIKSICEKTDMDMSQIDEYVPFIVNRGLSHFEDCVLWANEMNKCPTLDKDLQYLFLKGVINKKKRYSKWIKKQSDIDLADICQVYQVSERRASEIVKLLNKEQIEMIKERLNRGGR